MALGIPIDWSQFGSSSMLSVCRFRYIEQVGFFQLSGQDPNQWLVCQYLPPLGWLTLTLHLLCSSYIQPLQKWQSQRNSLFAFGTLFEFSDIFIYILQYIQGITISQCNCLTLHYTWQNDISQTIFSGDVPYILPTVQVSMKFEVLWTALWVCYHGNHKEEGQA